MINEHQFNIYIHYSNLLPPSCIYMACAMVPETRLEESEKTPLKSLPYIMSHTAKLGDLAILLAIE